jgi:hypothetical protein
MALIRFLSVNHLDVLNISIRTQLRYIIKKLLLFRHVKRTVPYRTITIYNRLPEEEPSGSKHVEDIKKLKIRILI